MIVHKMHRHFAFLHFVHAPGQEIGNGLAVAVRHQHSDHFTVIFSFMGGQAAFSCDRKLRTCQRLLGQLIRLFDLHPELDGRIGSGQVRGLIGIDLTIQADQLGGVAGRILMLPHGVFALMQRLRYRHAVRVRGHGADDLPGLINVKLYSGNGMIVQAIGFHQPDPAFCGFILTGDGIDFVVLRARHCDREAVIHIMLRHRGFCYFILTPGQQIGNGLALLIRGARSDYFSIASPIVGGKAGNAGDGEHSARQRHFCQAVRFHDFDMKANRGIVSGQLGGFIRFNFGIQRYQIGHIAFRVAFLLHRVLSLGQRIGNSDTLIIRGHAADLGFALVNVEYHTGNGLTVQPIRFGDLNFAFGWLILRRDLIHLVILGACDIHRKGILHIMGRIVRFLDLIYTPGEQIRNSFTLCVRSQSGNDFSISRPVMRRQAGNTGDGELRARKRLLR